jgi:protein-S-isoprenylcysteine O-methyltransferase Ste14
MSFPTLFNEANSLWLFFAIYFFIQYRPVRVKRNAPVSIFSFERLCCMLGLGLVFFPRMHFSVLAIPFHSSYPIALAGFGLVIAGLAFSAWARDLLGRNWSGRVIIQDSHQLITRGPYAYVRHPLYSGIVAAIAGTTLIVADTGAIIGFFFALAFFWLKASREERLLESEFGGAYTAYRAHTGGLFPRIAHV